MLGGQVSSHFWADLQGRVTLPISQLKFKPSWNGDWDVEPTSLLSYSAFPTIQLWFNHQCLLVNLAGEYPYFSDWFRWCEWFRNILVPNSLDGSNIGYRPGYLILGSVPPGWTSASLLLQSQIRLRGRGARSHAMARKPPRCRCVWPKGMFKGCPGRDFWWFLYVRTRFFPVLPGEIMGNPLFSKDLILFFRHVWCGNLEKACRLWMQW